MDNSLIQSINKFQKMGEDIKNSLSNRGAWGGWYKVLTELYPDNAHFLFELLQNAEDVYATKVKFELESDSLVFKHNGTKEFSESDIDSITNIGESSKKVNKIGKFGVGFKSVFSYTESPKIHTKAISFEIKDLVIPFLIDSQPIEKGFTTVFIFKFDKSDKPKKQAFKEIDQFFDEVDDSVLLFLSNIRSVEWTIKNNKPITITKEINGEFTEIKNTKIVKHKAEVSISSWLVFRKAIKVVKKTITVGVAFLYDREKKELQATEGNVSIYFPAKKETSKLKFHIDAPFSSSVARDSIVDSSDENNEILASIGQLCAESIYKIKELGILKLSFFEVLPNDEDGLSPFYKPILDALKEEFESNNELIPLGKGEFSGIDDCIYVSNNAFKNIFKDKEDINIVFDNDSLNGYAKVPRRTSRSFRFLATLNGFVEHDDDEIYEYLVDLSNKFNIFERYSGFRPIISDDERESVSVKIKWLENKSNEWLQSLYAFLSDANEYYGASFIKLADGSFNFSHGSLFFPQEGLAIDADLSFVESNTFTSGDNKKQQEKAFSWLESQGVESIDESIHVELLFDGYQFLSEEKHLIDINSLVALYVEDPDKAIKIIGTDYSQESFIFSESYVDYLYSTDGEDEYENKPLASADEVFIDLPYESTGLRFISQNDSYPFMISEIYKKLDNLSAFIDLLKGLGVKTQIEIEWANISYNDERSRLIQAKGKRFTYTGIHQDWQIKDLDRILKIEDHQHEISKLLWDFLSSVDKKHFSAVYRMNSAYDAVYADSQLTYTLKNSEWIPDKSGVFYKPSNISNEMLHPDLQSDKSNEWFKRIGLGEAVAEKVEEENIQKKVLEDMGLRPEDAALLKGANEGRIAEIIKVLERQKLEDSLGKSQGTGKTEEVKPYGGPDSVVLNPPELQGTIEGNIDNPLLGDSGSSNPRSPSSKDPKNTDEIRIFLYGQYEGHCQICGDTFMDSHDQNVFELYSMNRSKKGDALKSDVNRPGNSLSLCPKHHKIFNLGLHNFTFLEALQSSKVTQESLASSFEIRDCASNEEDEFYNMPEGSNFYVDDALMLPIKVFKKTLYIKFSTEHMLNFIVVFNEK